MGAAGVVLFVFTAVINDSQLGAILGLIGLEPHFSDWLAILAAGDAQRAGADIYTVPNPYDVFGRPHVYGPGWLLLGRVGFTVADTWWMGGLIAVAFALAAVAIMRPVTPARAVIAALILISPPVMLGLERANNDLVVFLLFALSIWVVARWASFGVWIAAVVLSLAATLKIYPVMALSALPAARRHHTVWVALAGSMIGCILVIWWYRAEFARVFALAPREVSIFTYGFKVTAELARSVSKQAWPLGLGLAMGLGVGVLWFGGRLRRIWRQVPLRGPTSMAYLAGAACWVFCYIANTNFPYRAVMLVLPARLWMDRLHECGEAALARRCLAVLLLLLWTNCLSSHAFSWSERFGDVLRPLFLLVVGFEHSLTLVVTVVLIVSLCGWAVRHVQDIGPRGLSSAGAKTVAHERGTNSSVGRSTAYRTSP